MKKLLPVLLLFVSVNVSAQTIGIEKTTKNSFDPKVTGGLNISSSYNSYFLENNLNLFASGNLNIAINQFNIPVNFNYSDRKFSFSQAYSFNQLSIRPTYKWASATIGTGNFNFSPYTLNGHQFLGAGFELNPNKWDVKLMYGRLQKASPLDSVAGHSYNRYGAGSKITYRFSKELKLGVTAFYAKDRENSIPVENQLFYNQVVNPQENLVLALDFVLKPLPFIEWKGEIANSLLTSNTKETVTRKLNSAASLFLNENSSSRSLSAFKTALNFHLGSSNSMLGLAYERIDPDYKTLGGYYFVNDLENISMNLTTNFLEDKISVFARFGVQRDDLENTKSISQNRWVGSLNSTLKPTDKMNISVGYSNFTSFQFVRDVYQDITRVPGQPIDSLDFSQISQDFNTSINQVLKSSEKVHNSLNLNFALLKSQGKNGQVVIVNAKSDIVNATLFYNQQFLLQKFSLNAGFTFNQNQFEMGRTRGLGPSLGLSKEYFDRKLVTTLNSNILFSEFNSQSITASNFYFISAYNPFPRQKISLNIGFINNGLGTTFTNANLGYNFSF